MGYAVIQENLLDVFFSRHVYKSLLGRSLNILLKFLFPSSCANHIFSRRLEFFPVSFRPYTVQDIEALDLSFYNSLKFVLENDPSPLELNFTVLEVNFGEVQYALSMYIPPGRHTEIQGRRGRTQDFKNVEGAKQNFLRL